MIVKPCRFAKTEGLGEFQAVNAPSDPIVGMPEAQAEQAFVNLVERIEEVLHDTSVDGAPEDFHDDELGEAAVDVMHPGTAWTTVPRCRRARSS